MKRYIATRGVSWPKGDGWVNREAGEDVSDAPKVALKDFLAVGSAKEATNGEE